MTNKKLPVVIAAVITEYNRVVPALEEAEKTKNTKADTIYKQKLALESVLGSYGYMLDWSPKTKQFTVYLDNQEIVNDDNKPLPSLASFSAEMGQALLPQPSKGKR